MTTASRINGIESLLRHARTQRVARLARPSPVLAAAIDRATPIQRLVLGVTFAKLKSDFGLRQLGPEIESVSAVCFEPEFIEQSERILRDKMAGAVIDVNSVLSRLYPVVVVLHLRRSLSNLATRVGKWL